MSTATVPREQPASAAIDAHSRPLVAAPLRRLLVRVAVCLAVAGVIAGLASLLRPRPSPHFFALWLLPHPTQWSLRETVAANDRAVLHSGGYFANWHGLPTGIPSRQMVSDQFAQLKQLQPWDRAVVYLAATCDIDEQDQLQVAVSGTPGTEDLPLREALAHIRDCPANHKLIVLDLAPPTPATPWETTAADVAQRVAEELKTVKDPNRLVLTACGAGQAPLLSEVWRRSGLGYYFALALTGDADGSVDGRRDGWVTAREAARFVELRVQQWAAVTQGAAQCPLLIGDGDDFSLVAVSLRERRNETSAPPKAEPEKYPKWLSAAWAEHQQLCNRRQIQLHPRLLRRWEAAILRAEQQWRGGRNANDLQQELERQLVHFRSEQSQASAALPAAAPFTVALLGDGQPPADAPAARQALGKFLADVAAKTQGMPAAAAATAGGSLIQAFLEKNAKLSDDAFVIAVVDALQAAAPVTPPLVQLLDELLRHRQPQPLYVETLLLRRLAELSQATPEDFNSDLVGSDLVGSALRVAALRGTVAACDRTFPWTQRERTAAAQLQHNGQYLLLRPGFAPAATAAAQLTQAEKAFEGVASRRDALKQAYETLDVALLRLPQLYRFQHGPAGGEWAWREAIKHACWLADALAVEIVKTDAAHASTDQQLDPIQSHTAALASLLAQLQEPFTAAATGKLIGLANRSDATSKQAALIGAALQWPGLSAAQRQTLLAAGQQLEVRLHDQLLAQQRSARDLQAALLAGAPRGDLPTAALTRRKASQALLQLGGVVDHSKPHAPTKILPLPLGEGRGEGRFHPSGRTKFMLPPREDKHHAERDDYSNLRTEIGALIDDTIQRGAQRKSAWQRARLGSILPVDETIPWLDALQSDPYLEIERDVRRRHYTWLAEQFAYAAHDDTPLLNAELSRRYAALTDSDSIHLGYLQFADVAALARPTQAQEQTDVDVAWQWIGRQANDLRGAAVNILQPSDSLRIEQAPLGGLRHGSAIRMTLPPGADDAALAGILVQVEALGRTWHQPLKFEPTPWSSSLELLISADKNQPGAPAISLRLRPSNDPQPYYLSLANPTDRAAAITVEIPHVGIATLDLAGKTTQPLVFKPPAPAPGGAAPEFDRQIPLIIRDAKTSEVLAARTLPCEVLSPQRYVRVVESRFDPGEEGDNRLEVKLAADNLPPGPPCVVELNLPPQTVPGLVNVLGGTLRGVLPGDGQPLTLTATGLQLIDGYPQQAEFSLTIDGAARAISFAADLPRRGDPTSVRQVARPGISMTPPKLALAGPGFQVPVHVLQAPADASVRLRICEQVQGGLTAQAQQTFRGPRRRQVQATAEKDGSLAFRVALKDWTFDVDTTGLVGRRMVVVDIVNRGGRSIASAQQPVIFDGSPPERAYLVEPPGEVLVNKPISLHIAGYDALSGVEKVLVFTGRPVNDQPPAGAKTLPAQQSPDGQHYIATLPPQKLAGPLDVTAQVVNGVGLSTFVTTRLSVVESLTIDGQQVQGVVLEGPRPQPQLKVLLLDDKNSAVATSTTDGQGRFYFQGVKPGRYTVFARKQSSGRRDRKAIQVKAGQDVNVTLELSL